MSPSTWSRMKARIERTDLLLVHVGEHIMALHEQYAEDIPEVGALLAAFAEGLMVQRETIAGILSILETTPTPVRSPDAKGA